MARILILVDDRPATTIPDAAQRYGLERSAMHHAILYAGLRPAARLDGRTPLYWVDELAEMMAGRPGKGAPGRARRDGRAPGHHAR